MVSTKKDEKPRIVRVAIIATRRSPRRGRSQGFNLKNEGKRHATGDCLLFLFKRSMPGARVRAQRGATRRALRSPKKKSIALIAGSASSRSTGRTFSSSSFTCCSALNL
jgi:hypothetical protein